MKQCIQMFTDFVFHSKVAKTVQLLSKHSSSPVFHFLYMYSSTDSFGDLAIYSKWKMSVKLFLQKYGIGSNMRNGYGVSHGDELFMTFKLPNLPSPMGTGPVTDRDRRTSYHLLNMWTHFARTGHPTLGSRATLGGFEWEPAKGGEHSRYAEITSRMRMVNDPSFWERSNFVSHVLSQVGLEADQVTVAREFKKDYHNEEVKAQVKAARKEKIMMKEEEENKNRDL